MPETVQNAAILYAVAKSAERLYKKARKSLGLGHATTVSLGLQWLDAANAYDAAVDRIAR